jgi:hypothetical protein
MKGTGWDPFSLPLNSPNLTLLLDSPANLGPPSYPPWTDGVLSVGIQSYVPSWAGQPLCPGWCHSESPETPPGWRGVRPAWFATPPSALPSSLRDLCRERLPPPHWPGTCAHSVLREESRDIEVPSLYPLEERLQNALLCRKKSYALPALKAEGGSTWAFLRNLPGEGPELCPAGNTPTEAKARVAIHRDELTLACLLIHRCLRDGAGDVAFITENTLFGKSNLHLYAIFVILLTVWAN